MGYPTREERIALAVAFVNQLTDQPQSLDKIAKALGKTKSNCSQIYFRLKKAGLIIMVPRNPRGIKRVPGKVVTEADVIKAFAYTRPGDSQLVECRGCNEKKKRIAIAGTTMYYVDDKGSRWYGRMCPECKADTYVTATKETITSRKCRSCPNFLPASRYFHCYLCQPELPSVDDDYIYEGGGGMDIFDNSVMGIVPTDIGFYAEFSSKGGDNEDDTSEETGVRGDTSDSI